MGRVVEVLVWWALLLGVWLLTLVAFSVAELVAGAVAAVPCAIVAVVGRRAVGGAWRVRPGWLRWLVPLPLAIVSDTYRVLVVALRCRPRSRRLGEVRLRPERTKRVARAQQAIATTVLSASPRTLVVDARPDEGVLAVHPLVGGRDRVEEAVRS